MNENRSARGLRGVDTLKLTLFAVRHLFGLVVFAWLTWEMRRLTEGALWIAVGLLGLAYFGFAAVSWTRLRAHYRRQNGRGARP